MRKAKIVSLHDGFFLPGGLGGDMPKTLPPANKTMPNLELYLLDSGQVEMKWGQNGVFNQYVIGAANVKGVLLDSSELETKSSKQPQKKSEPPKVA